MRRVIQATATALLMLVALSGCGTSDSPFAPPDTTSPSLSTVNNGAWTMTLAANPLRVAAGVEGTVIVTIDRTGGFTGGVTLDVTPSSLCGVSATSNNPVLINPSTATIVCSSMARGTFTAAIKGTGGSLTATLNLSVVVS